MRSSKLVYLVRRVLIFLYGASLCFGTFAIQGADRNYTLSLLVAILYAISVLPLIRNYREVLQKYGKYIYLPIAFVAMLIVINVFNANEYQVSIIPISLLSCIVLFVMMLLHSIDDPRMLRYGLYGFILGAIILSVLFMLDIGVDEEEDFYAYMMVDVESRMSMFEQNENELGLLMVNGIALVVMALLIYDKLKLGLFRFVFILPIFSLGSLLLASASRAAFVALVAVLVMIVMMHRTKGNFSRLLFITIGVLGIWYGFVNFTDSGLMYDRMLSTAMDGDSSGRAEIWEAIVPRLIETPILGVGQTGYAEICYQELGGIVAGMDPDGCSPHNVIIEVFAYTGIIGLIIMLSFWVFIAKDALVCYKYKNLIPLLLLMPIAASIMTGQILANKLAWMVYAYIIVSMTNYKSAHSTQ